MPELFVATQMYPWYQRYAGKGNWPDNYALAIEAAAEAGFDGWEPSPRSIEDLQQVVALMQQHGLELRSAYVGGPLHDERRWRTVETIEGIARLAQAHGASVIVVNPDPLAWGGTANKLDLELERQAEALDELGRRLTADGLKLAYHMHDAEFRAGAREFHHMLLATDPRHVQLCLDAHWIYRATENSQVALFDIIKLYGARVCSLHLRQSHQGIWTETFEDGDIDYRRVVTMLQGFKVNPLLVLEQAIEAETPQTISEVEASRRSIAYIRRIFATLAS